MRLFIRSILPILFILFLTWVGHYLFYVDGQIDWFRLMLVYGIPFGVPYMCIVLPIGRNSSAALAILVINIIIGALFGCVIAAVVLIRAVVYLIYYPLHMIIEHRI